MYSFHFIKLLCSLKVPNFNILFLLSSILKTVVPVVHCCSETEAESLGIFFSELFNILNHWSKRVNWQRECAGNITFCRKFGGEDYISFDDFVEKIVENFARRFTTQLNVCLEGSDKMYMKARCCLLILTRVQKVFPNAFNTADVIEKRLCTLLDTQGVKEDLRTLASGYHEILKKKMKKFPESQQNNFSQRPAQPTEEKNDHIPNRREQKEEQK